MKEAGETTTQYGVGALAGKLVSFCFSLSLQFTCIFGKFEIYKSLVKFL